MEPLSDRRWVSAWSTSPIDASLSETGVLDRLGVAVTDVSARTAVQLTAGGLPPNIEELLSGFRDRVQTLTPMERTVLQYYIDGCSLEEIAARAYISVATAKKHNTNINRKLGVTSREELMLYIDLFRRCGRLDEIAAPRAEDTARCTT